MNVLYFGQDRTDAIGSFDINGDRLAEDTGSDEYRRSYWYGTVGVIWIVYRALILRRSFILCWRYGLKCDEMGEKLRQKQAMVFVQESLRLSAHGATNYHRLALLYLIIEGLMTDLFLIIAKDGLETMIQYASLGYNLSGMVLLILEIIENTRLLNEKARLFIMRLVFSDGCALIGELVSAAALQHFLTSVNGSELKKSRSTALAVSYYVWSLVGHSLVVIVILGIIMSVRAVVSISYVWWRHRSLVIFSESCCIDTSFGPRSRIVMLSGYLVENGKLYYKPDALKAFGLLEMEEDDAEFLALQKLHWFIVPR